MKVGVLGGTFDPPHTGHLILAELARGQLALDCVRFVPAGDPWRKSSRAVTPAAHRLEMTRLAIADNLAFEIDDREVVREGPSYTAVTLQEMRRTLTPADELFFVLGEDALADLPYWREPATIAAAAWIVVAPREGVELPHALPFDRGRLLQLEMPYIGISSTDLRARVSNGLGLRYLVPPAVEAYIREHGLYA